MRPGATSEHRWQELVEVSVAGPVTLGMIFGSKGLRTGKKFFAVWWNGRLVVKLPRERVDELVRAYEGEPFEPLEGRPMGGWLVTSPSADWSALSDEARSYVESQQG